MADGYIVVFEYTDKAGGYAGVRTITRYKSEEEFKDLMVIRPEKCK